MDMGHYILRDRKPVKVGLMEWAMWLQTHSDERRIARDKIGDCIVSTVFLGLDYRFGGNGPPILFDTMTFCAMPQIANLFGREFSYYPETDVAGESQRRHCHYDEALSWHNILVARLTEMNANADAITRESIARLVSSV